MYSAPKHLSDALLAKSPSEHGRRRAPAVSQLLGASASIQIYCTYNAQLSIQEKDDLAEALGSVFQDQSWGKGTNLMRAHLDAVGSFTLSVCSKDGAMLAAAMLDCDPREVCVIRMMATHPGYRLCGCARLLNAVIHEECRRRKVRLVCVEVNTGHEAAAIWNHFGYNSPGRGALPQLVSSFFKDTSFLMMKVRDDAGAYIQKALQKVHLSEASDEVSPAVSPVHEGSHDVFRPIRSSSKIVARRAWRDKISLPLDSVISLGPAPELMELYAEDDPELSSVVDGSSTSMRRPTRQAAAVASEKVRTTMQIEQDSDPDSESSDLESSDSGSSDSESSDSEGSYSPQSADSLSLPGWARYIMNTSPNLVPGELLKPKTATGWSMKVKLPGQPVKDAAIHTNAAKDADHDFSWDYPPETRQLIWKVQREILAVSITVVIEHIRYVPIHLRLWFFWC